MDVSCPNKALLTKQATDWIWSMGHNLLIPELKEEGILIFKDKKSLNYNSVGRDFRDAGRHTDVKEVPWTLSIILILLLVKGKCLIIKFLIILPSYIFSLLWSVDP